MKIGPFKEEEAYLSPRIVIFHDVASEADIEMIKARATPRFKRATVQNYKTGELETAMYRISKTAWLKPEEDIRIANIYRRVASVTKLNMETSEELQVSNYGIGGHYEPHFDFARREEKNAFASLGTGNRIATWLFYVRFILFTYLLTTHLKFKSIYFFQKKNCEIEFEIFLENFPVKLIDVHCCAHKKLHEFKVCRIK